MKIPLVNEVKPEAGLGIFNLGATKEPYCTKQVWVLHVVNLGYFEY